MITRCKNLFLIAIAVVSIITGIIGIFVPLLPTTCFIILAAWCLAKSEPDYLKRAMTHPRLGHLFKHISPRFMPREIQPGR